MRILNFVESILYIVAGIVSIKILPIVENFADKERGYDGLGGEIFVPLVLYTLCFIVIKILFENIRKIVENRNSIKENLSKTAVQAVVKIKSNGECIVYNKDNTTISYKNFAAYLRNL